MEPLTNAMATGRTKQLLRPVTRPKMNESPPKKGEESSSTIQLSGDDLLVISGGVPQSARHPGSTVSHHRFFSPLFVEGEYLTFLHLQLSGGER